MQNYQDSVDSEKKDTCRFRVCGIVQGVGFRPFVHRLARTHGATGWVLNDSEGVLLELQASSQTINNIIDELISQPPPLARITDIYKVELEKPAPYYSGFDIRKSNNLSNMDTIVPPDSNVCKDCLREMNDPSNHRYRYAFINCTNCGPRYSIICGMPYDRAQTTMQSFIMCPQCNKEYHDIEDRRYHAQPNACPVCGPQLQLTDKDGVSISANDIIRFTIDRLKEGAIVAIKSLGGFHLVVDASNVDAVRELRRRKRRDAKPFAVMVADSESAARWAVVTPDDISLLESGPRPIVLLRKRSQTLPEVVAPKNPNLGVMLPSTPVQHMLLADPELPVVIMTSGNISGQPIVIDNNDAIEQLGKIADYFVLNNRDIRTRVDDSVVRVIKRKNTPDAQISFLRRSRGYAPYPVHLPYSVGNVVAFGAELKTTISIGKGKQVFISQHIGDLKNDTTFKSHLDCIKHLQGLLAIEKADILACDLHPAFRSTRSALENAEIRVIQVQHHHAHMAACMAENGLSGKTIGVIFDGTGYGSDGTIWGGEFLFGDFESVERVAHLRPMLLPGGDKAVKEPIRMAISLLVETYGENVESYITLPAILDLSENRREVFTWMVARKINTTMTSSMGRLFDGVSALIGICSEIEYEAQAAIEMEALLKKDFHMVEPFTYIIDEIHNGDISVDYRPLVKELVQSILVNNINQEDLSRRFHSTIVHIIATVCSLLSERYGTDQIVLSGGVFCNEFLLVNTLDELESRGLKPYCHKLVPGNDGCISLGQVVVAANDMKI
ncbi:carbamoyltransferase HypF [Escherichia sp. E2661]|uniref:carbamoyltransferase HypF n=1 Tax=Escherichia sp. E2661 TaxID=2044459 RepID=UPI001081FABC|nr:carbamoyltransferase HypF [Escherichia sp. E2661]TGB98142.1 carbamoyltransferase HypF [Escherichia sp. E2661]